MAVACAIHSKLMNNTVQFDLFQALRRLIATVVIPLADRDDETKTRQFGQRAAQ